MIPRLIWTWIATLVIAMIGLTMVGCAPAPDLTPIAGQVDFSAGAWNARYRRDDAPPAIEWVRGADLDCGGGAGFMRAGECRVGWHETGAPFVTVALPGERPNWDTLCHEFEHVRRWRDRMPDPDDHSLFPFDEVEKCAKDMAVLQGEGR